MKRLTPNLFQRRFQDFVEIGRARLPSLAPAWTDHNAHDPGITLMELLAWVAEAELYSLSRLRRDERAAYAALLGVSPHGTRGARGLIWPDRLDPNSPYSTFTKSVVLPVDAVVEAIGGQSPTFRPTHSILWAPGRITSLETRDAKGCKTDQLSTNQRGELPFFPLGERAGSRDVLALGFECRDESGLFGSSRPVAKGAYWSIGLIAAVPPGTVVEPAADEDAARSPLSAELVTEDDRFDLRIAFDSTRGLLDTGVLLLDVDEVAGSPRKFVIELRSRNGSARPPRLLRIEPNVVPILQGRTISRELHVANGAPDWSFALDAPGLRFAGGAEPVVVEVAEAAGMTTWKRCDRLSDQGPADDVYQLDAKAGELTFGNGINGRIPPADAQVFVTYAVSDGAQGRVARNRKWKVAGFAGVFGVNPDPIAGGEAESDWIDQRREARRRTRNDHALVSSNDIEAAAKAIPLLDVVRAWAPKPDDRAPRTGVVTLIAMRRRDGGTEPEQPPETARWLESIRRQLAPRMPLGTRLAVVAPRYVEFSIETVLEAHAGRNPVAVKEAVEKELTTRLALVESAGATPRQPGVPVTQRDVRAWIRATDGVKRVVQLQLRGAKGERLEEIAVLPSGLPRWNSARSRIEVKRPELGRPR